jgi:DNA-binding FadR family transcriptional regulator
MTLTEPLAGRQARSSNAQLFANSKSRTEAAAQMLAEIAQQAGPGVRLGTKEELRQQCEVSVGTFNEALKVAENRGLVTLRPGPGGGIFSQAPSAIVRLGNLLLALDRDDETVAEAVHVRNALDVLLMDDAVAHRTAADIASLRQEMDNMTQAVRSGDPTTFVKHNWHLHAVIANISPNSILKNFYLGLLEVIEQHTMAVQPTREQPLQSYIEYRLELHQRMVDAIEDQDLERARELVAEHNTESYQNT